MYGQSISLEDISRASCLSPNHLIRTFKKAYGTTPIQYAHNVRMQKAKDYLMLSSLSIGDVCRKTGFSSLGTFSNNFMKYTGMAPGKYRNQKGDFE